MIVQFASIQQRTADFLFKHGTTVAVFSIMILTGVAVYDYMAGLVVMMACNCLMLGLVIGTHAMARYMIGVLSQSVLNAFLQQHIEVVRHTPDDDKPVVH
jgi:hypothetical protein